MAADTDGGSDGGQSVSEWVCVCLYECMQIGRPEGEHRSGEGERGIRGRWELKWYTHPQTQEQRHIPAKKKRLGREMSRYSNCFACLTIILVCASSSSYLQIDRNFSQGDKTSTSPAALPILHSHPHQCQAPLIKQLSNIQPTSSKCSLSNAIHFISLLSPQQRPNGAQLPLQQYLESYAVTLALLQSHSAVYCTLNLGIYKLMTFYLLIFCMLLSGSFTLSKISV